MTELFETHSSLVVALILAPLVALIRAAVKHPISKRDLRGALVLFATFFVLRAVSWALPAGVDPSLAKIAAVGWMVAFAFALIRTLVSVAIALLRARRNRDVPKILRDVVDFSLYLMAAVPIVRSQLSIDLTGLLATSAVLSLVLGLALQDTLGNLFAGLALQFERPYEIGDWVTIGADTGKVVQVSWRSIRIETTRREVVTLPNSVVGREALRKRTRGQHAAAAELNLTLSYDAPPNKVKALLAETLTEIPEVLQSPPFQIFTFGFDENGVRYRVRFYTADYPVDDRVVDQLYSRLWYQLRREGVEIPLPQRIVHMRQERPSAEREARDFEGLLRSVDILSMLSDEERRNLATELRPQRFGRGEEIIEQGKEGETFFLIADGRVSVRAGHPPVEVSRMERGGYFGEMSLLTGEPRTAAVVALEDTLVLSLDRKPFAQLFQSHPELAKELSARLAERRTQLRAALEAAEHAHDSSREAGRILGRLRQIFSLRD